MTACLSSQIYTAVFILGQKSSKSKSYNSKETRCFTQLLLRIVTEASPPHRPFLPSQATIVLLPKSENAVIVFTDTKYSQLHPSARGGEKVCYFNILTVLQYSKILLRPALLPEKTLLFSQWKPSVSKTSLKQHSRNHLQDKNTIIKSQEIRFDL